MNSVQKNKTSHQDLFNKKKKLGTKVNNTKWVFIIIILYYLQCEQWCMPCARMGCMYNCTMSFFTEVPKS